MGEYTPSDRIGDGGGIASEGEDIEVLELGFDQAIAMVDSGETADGKTIMLLQYLQLRLMKPRSLIILVAGPYRSGTGDDPALLALLGAERGGDGARCPPLVRGGPYSCAG